MKWLPALSFPILGKELAEQAVRKRTYGLRLLCAFVLFAVFFGTYLNVIRFGASRSVLASRKGSIPISCRRVTLLSASLVCNVENTK